MAIIQGLGGQVRYTPLFDASGAITSGGTSQLALAVSRSRTYFLIQNLNGSSYLYVETGSARATASISGGAVTGCTITNGGFNFTYPPLVTFIGGGSGNTTFLGAAQEGYPAPGFSEGSRLQAVSGDRPAQAHCVLTDGVVTSIAIDDPGQGYVAAPLVAIRNDPRDPNGCADPYYNSVLSGVQLGPGGSWLLENSLCNTDSVAVWGNTTDQAYTIKYSP